MALFPPNVKVCKFVCKYSEKPNNIGHLQRCRYQGFIASVISDCFSVSLGAGLAPGARSGHPCRRMSHPKEPSQDFIEYKLGRGAAPIRFVESLASFSSFNIEFSLATAASYLAQRRCPLEHAGTGAQRTCVWRIPSFSRNQQFATHRPR